MSSLQSSALCGTVCALAIANSTQLTCVFLVHDYICALLVLLGTMLVTTITTLYNFTI